MCITYQCLLKPGYSSWFWGYPEKWATHEKDPEARSLVVRQLLQTSLSWQDLRHTKKEELHNHTDCLMHQQISSIITSHWVCIMCLDSPHRQYFTMTAKSLSSLSSNSWTLSFKVFERRERMIAYFWYLSPTICKMGATRNISEIQWKMWGMISWNL